MSTLTFYKKHIQGHALGAPSRFPAIALPIKYSVATELDEDDGLFINYGISSDSLPYTMNDNYDGPLEELEFDAAVLENSHIRAEVVISLGGRLWSIYDKDSKRDLIVDNHQFRPGNLAIRDAWFAGGIEYNIGRRGHDAQTCNTRFAAVTTDDDGTPVLRIYEFSRDALTPFQIDFFLPDDSKFLYARVRITNPTEQVMPMYWWSNIAVEEREGCRVIVPTYETYANAYLNGHHALSKIKLPDGAGYDGTYPTNHKKALDYFFKIPENSRKFETVIYPDGKGFAFCSTARLQGRKLFVWGQGAGGKHWQRNLMAPDTPDYIEIQGGVAHTQSECLPMPPKTVWEWLEAYGPIEMPPEKCFGDWDTAVKAVSAEVDRIMPQEKLDELFLRTRKSISLKPATCKVTGTGWGALENLLRKKNSTPQLDFGEVGPEQADWKQLLETGEMNDEPPTSYMVQDEWFELLKKAKPGWKVLFHLALNYYRRNDLERAYDCMNKSLALSQNAWNLQTQAYFFRFAGRKAEASALFQKALELEPDDASLAKSVLRSLRALGDYAAVQSVWNILSEQVKARPMNKFLYADALAHTGKLQEAEAIIMANGGLEIPDIREGEISTSELYIYIQVEKAKLQGITLDPKQVQVPRTLDLRMS